MSSDSSMNVSRPSWTAYRLPCATMPFGATAAEIICDGVNGFLTQNNKEAMAAKIRQIISNRQLLKDVGHIASKTVANSWEKIIETVQQRYLHLIQNN